ncbi:helix-turn-helix transcriptional regulator [Corynebacterium phoceense]|uniref:helix-turn-helix domain-containing protein n=1 Tax=Corynebacterium phoceense TaxID=1686286 RepID=UPI0034CD8272
MIITFKPLWKLLIDRDITREDLRHATGLSPVTTDVLARICQALDCNLEQIALATSRRDPSCEKP